MKARHKDTGEIIELAEEGIISHDGRRFCWYQVELIPEPIDEVKPSLSSNLDEAEFEYMLSLDGIPANQEEDKMIYDAFKAGAEWMAEQGVSVAASIIDQRDDGHLSLSMPVNDTNRYSVFKDNDKVIVQIRKK